MAPCAGYRAKPCRLMTTPVTFCETWRSEKFGRGRIKTFPGKSVIFHLFDIKQRVFISPSFVGTMPDPDFSGLNPVNIAFPEELSNTAYIFRAQSIPRSQSIDRKMRDVGYFQRTIKTSEHCIFC